MRLGVDLDDVVAECALPYLRKFAEEFGVELPPEPGWQTLDAITEVSDADKVRFRQRTYDGTFFGELEMYTDAPAVLERLASAGHEIYFVTARAERRRVITETWLRDKGIFDHAKAVHLRPQGDFSPTRTFGRYDPSGSARYKVGLAEELELQAFCEDDRLISRELAQRGIRVFLFDHPWNRDVEGPRIERVSGWSELGEKLGL
ncbi:MAG: hypothetical protein KGQ88_02900 [Chloroflexi bacterium]|nr:hypothetical protein [Chloroflexota bacterium]